MSPDTSECPPTPQNVPRRLCGWTQPRGEVPATGERGREGHFRLLPEARAARCHHSVERSRRPETGTRSLGPATCLPPATRRARQGAQGAGTPAGERETDRQIARDETGASSGRLRGSSAAGPPWEASELSSRCVLRWRSTRHGGHEPRGRAAGRGRLWASWGPRAVRPPEARQPRPLIVSVN